MVSTHLKNISQIGSFPQVGVKIKNIWNHHLVIAYHIQPVCFADVHLQTSLTNLPFFPAVWEVDGFVWPDTQPATGWGIAPGVGGLWPEPKSLFC